MEFRQAVAETGPFGRRAGVSCLLSVSTPRSSNRTCGFPASGFRTGSHASPIGRSSHPDGAAYQTLFWMLGHWPLVEVSPSTSPESEVPSPPGPWTCFLVTQTIDAPDTASGLAPRGSGLYSRDHGLQCWPTPLPQPSSIAPVPTLRCSYRCSHGSPAVAGCFARSSAFTLRFSGGRVHQCMARPVRVE